MSGIMAAMTAGETAVVSDLRVFASVIGGSVPVSVTTASGSSNGLPGGGSRFFSASADGGSPPYSYLWQRQNGANKTVLESPSGTTAYISWSGMISGEYMSTTARCRVTDSDGRVAYSSTIVIGITRV